MKRFLIALVTAVLTAAQVAAQSADRPAITGTIQNQLDAFQADDFATAFTFASPMIQGMFGSPDRFGTMVRNGYPMVWRPGAVRYLDLREIGGRLWQQVLITDLNGTSHVLDYQMIEGPDGWRINGVQILRLPGTGA